METGTEVGTVQFVKKIVSSTVVRVRTYQQRGQGMVPLSWQDVLNFWITCDLTFGAEFHKVLRSCCFEAFYWECPPMSAATLSDEFQCVLVKAPEAFAQRRASPSGFADHIARAQHEFTTAFFNIGRDAQLVVPTHAPGTEMSAYNHLASFCRHADGRQQLDLWRRVGDVAMAAMRDSPGLRFWLNTDGSAVPWLHVRLDKQPKYIKYSPYMVHRTHEVQLPRSMPDVDALSPCGPPMPQLHLQSHCQTSRDPRRAEPSHRDDYSMKQTEAHRVSLRSSTPHVQAMAGGSGATLAGGTPRAGVLSKSHSHASHGHARGSDADYYKQQCRQIAVDSIGQHATRRPQAQPRRRPTPTSGVSGTISDSEPQRASTRSFKGAYTGGRLT